MKNPANTEYPVFIMQCGCRWKRDELITVKTDNALHCKDHPENKIDYIERLCDCGKLLTLTARTLNTKYCPDCKTRAYNKMKYEATQRYFDPSNAVNSKVSNKQQACSDRWDCVNRDKCLDHAAKNNKAINCYKCEKYLSAADVAIGDRFAVDAKKKEIVI